MRRVLVVTGTIVFLDAMLFGAIIPLLPAFADTYDLTKLEAGALLGAYGAGALVGGIPGGLLIGDDYTGPEHHRTTVPALRHARALLDLLQPPGTPPPTRLARLRDRLIDLDHAFRLRRRPSRPLPDVLAPRFRLLDHRPQLGTLLQRILAVAEPLLDPEDDRDAAFLRLLCWYEEILTDAAVTPAEYACFVAVRTGALAG